MNMEQKEFKEEMGIEPDSKEYFYSVRCYLTKSISTNGDPNNYGRYSNAVKLRDALQSLGIWASICEEKRL